MENSYSDIDLARYFSGQCTDTEKQSIESWSESSPENKELFSSARFVWERSLEAVNVPYKTEDALGIVHARLGMNNSKKLVTKTLTVYSKIAAIAAVIMLPLLFFYFLSKNNRQSEIAYKTISTENEIRTIKLEDGSEVWLNQNSTLSVPELKGNSYVIKLKGEAYFQVAKNSSRVFVVETAFSTVKVLGTAFNLKANEIQSINELTVTEGKVLFSKNSSPLEKIVEKGKKASLFKNKETIDLENITDENFLSWKTRILKFRDTPFIEVAKKLSDFYGISFIVTDSTLKNEPFSTTIINQSADDIAKILQMAHDNIEVIKTESGYNIAKKK